MGNILINFITFSCLLNGMGAFDLSKQTLCPTNLNIRTQGDNFMFEKNLLEDSIFDPKFELFCGEDSRNETVINLKRYLGILDKLPFQGCLGIVLKTDDAKLLEAMIKVVTSTRKKIELVLVTKSLKEYLTKIMTGKPTFDSVIIDTNSSSAVNLTRLNALSSPQWKNINISYFKIPPYSYSPKDTQELTGIDIDMLHLVSGHLKLNPKLIKVRSFNTLATNLVDGISDASISQPGFTYARYSKGIQFSQIITEGSLHIAAAFPGPVDKLHTITYPFSQAVWFFLSLSVVLVAVFLFINKHLLETNIPTYYSTCIAGVSLINESLPGIYLKAREKNYSALIAIFMWLLIGGVISYAYRSILLASLVSVEYEKPVDSFQDLLDNNILLTMGRGTILTDLLANSPNPVLRKIEAESGKNGGYYKLLHRKTPQNITDMRNNGQAAWLTTPIYNVGKRHSFRLSKGHLPPTKYGFYYRLNMPHIPTLEKAIRHVMDNGIYQYIINRHIWLLAQPEREYKYTSEPVNQSEPLEIRHILAPLLLLGAGLVFSILSVITEWFRGKYFSRKLKDY